jgi:hypothetical protein
MVECLAVGADRGRLVGLAGAHPDDARLGRRKPRLCGLLERQVKDDRSIPLRSATWLSCRQLLEAARFEKVFLIVFCSAADHTCA